MKHFGVINKDGICSECRRSINEIRAGIKSKNQNNDIIIPLTKTGKQQIGKPKTVKADKWLSCPKCEGKAFGGRGCWIIGLMILTFPIGLLLLLLKPTYNCSECGYRFQA